MIRSIKAAAHYGDWEGNASADDAVKSVRHWLAERGKFKQGSDFVVAIELAVLDTAADRDQPHVRALIAEAAGYDDFRSKLAAAKAPLPLRSVEMQIGVVEFMKLFKDFSVTLRARDLNISAYEFDIAE